MGYTIVCDVCLRRGHYSNSKFYNKEGIELIEVLKEKILVPKNIKDICSVCFKEALENDSFFEELEEVTERLQIGL